MPAYDSGPLLWRVANDDNLFDIWKQLVSHNAVHLFPCVTVLVQRFQDLLNVHCFLWDCSPRAFLPHLVFGVYQMGDDQARSWIEDGTFVEGATPRLTAS